MVEEVESFCSKLQRVFISEIDLFRYACINIPASGSAEEVSRRHICRKWAETRSACYRIYKLSGARELICEFDVVESVERSRNRRRILSSGSLYRPDKRKARTAFFRA